MTTDDNYQYIWDLLKRLFHLKTENFKLILSHKLTIFLGTTALAMIGLILGGLVIAFLSLALARFLSDFMPLYCGYLIAGGVLVVLFIIVFAARRTLIMNPLARFISRLFFEN